MYQTDKPRHRVKMIAAAAGLGAMAVMGVITAIDGTPATVGGTTDNRDRRPQRRPTGNTDQTGISQRVTKQPLHGHTRQRQHSANRQPQ